MAKASENKWVVVVESPTKASTVKQYLNQMNDGNTYEVYASYGHVMDLIPKTGAVDPDRDFEMHYQPVERNQKHMKKITTALRSASTLCLATDPDREGEAISANVLHLVQTALPKKKLNVVRAVFHQITRKALEEAMANCKGIETPMVHAQQARRALDFLVGFYLSPLLWKKINRGLSAGRVQSPALRMIWELEEKIEAFKPEEYHSVTASWSESGKKEPLTAKLTQFEGEPVKQMSIANQDEANRITESIKQHDQLVVAKVEHKSKKRNPYPPYTTSTLQQDASRKLGFSASRIMRLAQNLYEGVDLPKEGKVGMITYMRTDSVHLADEAVDAVRQWVSGQLGEDFLPETPNRYKTKQKNAQEAHEAIRPSSPTRTPESLKGVLENDLWRLYRLIWQRTVGSQMVPAVVDTVGVDLNAGDVAQFRLTGSKIRFLGYLKVYELGSDEPDEDILSTALPAYDKGDVISPYCVTSKQHFTEPPARFNEAKLIQALESYGIGRPSTYTSIITTLLHREYVELNQKRFYLTDQGRMVAKFLHQHFERYVDYTFTAKMEDDLDAISRDEKDWKEVLRTFWSPFHQQIQDKEEAVKRSDVKEMRLLGQHPKTGENLYVKIGRFGPYVQVGDGSEDKKPRFVGLMKGQKMQDLELSDALALLVYPKTLGKNEAGEDVLLNRGPYGFYVQIGKGRASLGEVSPEEITLEQAMDLIKNKKTASDLLTFEDEGIVVKSGRYGPYVTDGKRNASVPKDTEPKTMTLAACQKLLAEKGKPIRGGRRKQKK
jgi:DNA topoisomerase I